MLSTWMNDQSSYVLPNVCERKKEKEELGVVIEMKHPCTQVVYGGIASVHKHGHDIMDEMLCVWIEKLMGGCDNALHLDERPIKLHTPQYV